MFDLEASACSGELVFMERYKEVLVELGRVEQKMENQSMSSSSSSSEGLGTAAASGAGRSRVGSSGRSTLQAIGSAAAAGSTSQIFSCSQFREQKRILKHLFKSGFVQNWIVAVFLSLRDNGEAALCCDMLMSGVGLPLDAAAQTPEHHSVSDLAFASLQVWRSTQSPT